MNNSRRTTRFSQLLPDDVLKYQRCLVIGVGAIGRQVCGTLATMGFPSVVIYDDDVVKEVNLGPQGFFNGDLTLKKVNAVERYCHNLNPKMDVIVHDEKFSPRTAVFRGITCIFMCIDSLPVRKVLWERVFQHHHIPYIDGRMSVEYFEIYSLLSNAHHEDYEKSLLGPQFVGSCTHKSTFYCAGIVANYMIAQYIKYTRQLTVPYFISLNIATDEYTVVD